MKSTMLLLGLALALALASFCEYDPEVHMVSFSTRWFVAYALYNPEGAKGVGLVSKPDYRPVATYLWTPR